MSNPFERLRAITHWGGTDDGDLATQAAGALASMAREPAGLVVACRRMLAYHPANAALWWVCAQVLASDTPGAAARDAASALDRDRTSARLAASLPLQAEGAVCAVVGWPRAVDGALAERLDIDALAVRADGVDTVAEVRARHSDRSVPVLDAYELAGRDVSHLLVPARAMGDGQALVAPGVPDVMAEVRARTVIWLIGGVGRVLPARLLRAVVAASGAQSTPGLLLDEDAAGVLLSLERFDRVVGPNGVEHPQDAIARPDCPVPAELLRPLD